MPATGTLTQVENTAAHPSANDRYWHVRVYVKPLHPFPRSRNTFDLLLTESQVGLAIARAEGNPEDIPVSWLMRLWRRVRRK